MMKTLTRCILAALTACLMSSCGWNEPEIAPIRRVVLFYGAAYSNLSSSIEQDVQELTDGSVSGVGSSDVLLVYTHNTAQYRDFTTPTNPVLFRTYKDLSGKTRRDTLVVYPDTDVSSSPEVLHKVLGDVKDLFPAKSYGLIFSSHAKGWLPVNYEDKDDDIIWLSPARSPDTRELGTENQEGSGIDIRSMVDAIPMPLDFMILDACLMGCVEFAYELKDKCRTMVLSPTEILKDGFIYTAMAERIMNTSEPDLQQICQDYADFYLAGKGVSPSATITLVDCTRMDALADVCKDLVAAHRYELAEVPRGNIQPYFYNELHWFYDLRDVFVQAGISGDELARLDEAIANCVLYSFATPTFFGVSMDRVCGLSMYFPFPDKLELNNYYKTLSWNKATGLIQ